ncbi:MAG TPA: prolyl oligopeptidase family serine peptidase [Blastocatellia bacterium]|nr:prolyl oligopeptidase family serine peptidase [Blastocatellia bacterium]
MKRTKIALRTLLFLLLIIPPVSTRALPDTPQPRPMEIKDIMAWKRIVGASVSNDGQWFGYRLSPLDGDSEVVIRRTGDSKELRFPVGEAAAGGFGSAVTFSDDSKWAFFSIAPTRVESKRMRQMHRPIYNKVALINLTNEKKIEFEKVKRASFSGEQANYLALHRYTSEAQDKEKDRWAGSDLILYDLASAAELSIGNVSEFAFDKSGKWLTWIIDAQDKIGNGVELRNMATGAVLPLDNDKASYKSLNWTEKGEGLAVLKGVEDKAYEDKLYSAIGFTDFSAAAPRKVSYDPRDDKDFPAGMSISPNRPASWTEDMNALLFGIQDVKKKPPTPVRGEGQPPADDAATTPPPAMPGTPAALDQEKPNLVIWHWKDSRLQSMQQVQEAFDKNYSYLSIYRVDDKKFIRLADDKLRTVSRVPKDKFAIGTDVREYELHGNLDGQNYRDIYVVDLKTGSRKLALKKNRYYFGASPDGSHFLYYDDGQFFAYDMTNGQVNNLTQQVPAVFFDSEDDHNVVKPPIPPVGWVKDGVSVLLSDNYDIWNVPVNGGKAVNLTVNGKKDGIRYTNHIRLDPNEKGIDLSGPAYFAMYGEWTKKTGIARIDGGQPGPKVLLWGDAGYASLMKAKSAETFLYTRDTYKDFPDYYVANADLQNGQRITDADPQQKDIAWSSGVKLIDYTSAQGKKLQGALYLPANYEPGKSYPTIVYIYEKLSQGLNRYAMPTANGFNKSYYTSQGFAVLMPDIVYKVNDPGMSAVWCVVPAVKAAIATGIVDANKVGLQGHSWGGYQTAFLVTQTNVFKAAVAGAPLTDMVSMYSSIYWNSGSANQPIFESSQGRFTGSYLDNVDAYIRNSPVYHAKDVKTPLMILANDKDGAVDWNQGIEYYNTLRRLEKPVVMLEYPGENHGLAIPANQKDYTVRMKEFFDYYLLDKTAPGWLIDGVPRLKLKDHIDERAKELNDKGKDKTATGTEGGSGSPKKDNK